MSNSASAVARQDQEETVDATQAILKQVEALLAKPIALSTKFLEVIDFFTSEGVSEIDEDLGETLKQMESGDWGETFAHLVRSNKEREDHYTDVLTVSKAVHAIATDYVALLEFVIESEEGIEKVWAAMMRAKDADWKPEPEGDGATGGE
ncbi:MAG TPA: hypothetical protein PK109_00165 [Candidatus Paceibacterota bacterium]|nr:hypothetical protein [Candidatus Paceibacterota bacterium]